MERNLIKDTLHKISQQHIVPEPRWKYLLKKYGTWFMFALIAFLASISLSAAFSQLSQLDWDVYRFTHQNFVSFLLSILPLFWIVLLAAFSVLAFLDVRKTEMGYRFSRLKIFSMVIVGTLVLGYAVTNAGVGKNMNSMMANNSYMQAMMTTKQSQWSQPQKGLISGEILSISDGEIALKDFSGQNWNVSFDDQTLLRPTFVLSVGQKIKVIGTALANKDFAAAEIRPWEGGGMMQGFSTAHMQNMGMMRGANRNGTSENGTNGNNGRMMNRGGGMMRNY